MGLEGQMNGTAEGGSYPSTCLGRGGFLQGSDWLGQTGKPGGNVLGKKETHLGSSYERVSMLGASSTLCTGHLDLCPRAAVS